MYKYTNPIVLMVLISSCLLVGHNSQAQVDRIAFPAHEEGKSYVVKVSLPVGYSKNENKNYPTLFVLDANWDFELISSIYRSLNFDKHIPEMILVGFGYTDDVNINTERMKDYTPTEDPHFGYGGGADLYYQTINEQIIPDLSRRYRIDNNRKIIAGHSLGGLFVLHSLYQNSADFSHYIALSPSALWGNENLIRFDENYSDTKKKFNTSLFLVIGSQEYPPYKTAFDRYLKNLKAKQYSGLQVAVEVIEGRRHVGTKAEGLTKGLLWAFEDDHLPGVSGLHSLYKGSYADK